MATHGAEREQLGDVFLAEIDSLNEYKDGGLNAAYDSDGGGEILINNAFGALKLRLAEGTNEDKLQEYVNITGQVTASIDGNGNFEGESFKSSQFKIYKTLPITGFKNTIYFDNGVLKVWNGTSYVTVVNVFYLNKNYYAKKADIVTVAGELQEIVVIEDEDNGNTFTHYFYNGTELQWIVSVNQ